MTTSDLAIMTDHLERMRAIVAQAVAEGNHHGPGGRLRAVHLTVYGGMSDSQVRALFAEASRSTPAEGAAVHIDQAGSRYICWNCCGLRFESQESTCPNCGEEALEIPEEIGFGLHRVEVTP
jgi:Zn finger protein HypA/HybF involved in hydrogenase expression